MAPSCVSAQGHSLFGLNNKKAARMSRTASVVHMTLVLFGCAHRVTMVPQQCAVIADDKQIDPVVTPVRGRV